VDHSVEPGFVQTEVAQESFPLFGRQRRDFRLDRG